MNKGIRLNKIILTGKDKQDAYIELETGLNVISGASDTGKSYLLSCIDYIFGASSPPKKVEESNGYNELIVELSINDEKICLTREIGSNNIYLIESNYELFRKKDKIKLSTTHNVNNTENISNFILNKIGMSRKRLKSNKQNRKENLSFRDLIKYLIINEEKVISETSPFLTGQKTSETKEKSLFKLIMTGNDDDKLEEIQDPKLFKSEIKGKINYINKLITKKQQILLDLKLKKKDLKEDEFNQQISDLINSLDEANKEVLEKEKKREKYWHQIEKISIEIKQKNELYKRFQLLKEHYTTDLERLEFINEGSNLIDQLEDVNCPICASELPYNKKEIFDNQFKKSLRAEYKKINRKKKELEKTSEQIRKDKDALELSKTDIISKFEEINSFINNKLKPIYNVNKSMLESYVNLNKEIEKIEIYTEEIKQLDLEVNYYEEKLKEKKEVAKEKFIAEEYLANLTNKIQTLLKLWDLDYSVTFNKEVFDIELSGKPRNNFGKGYRAIFLSAIMISIMKYCLENKLKHPNFLIIDSPLTSFKEKDNQIISEDEKLPETVQDKFFKTLSEMKDIHKIQIIILDNKDPPDSIETKINHIHFSRNEKVGRYGFFPQ